MANRYIPFGYEIIDGLIKIVEREAEVVRSVYALYIQGLSLIEIANRLNMLTISYANDGRVWDKHIVKRMLENPKYKGDKGYPTGELPMYYIKNHHIPIIPPEMFDMVQVELARRNSLKAYSDKNISMKSKFSSIAI